LGIPVFHQLEIAAIHWFYETCQENHPIGSLTIVHQENILYLGNSFVTVFIPVIKIAFF
jgi:hypothetical protein